MKRRRSFILCLNLLCFLSKIYSAVDTITPTQSIRDGETLVSAEERFELGFFSPGSSKNRYLGIWYKRISIQTIVWVANRNAPITDSTGVLKIDNARNLVLVDRSASVFWSANLSNAEKPIAQLLNSGNLLVREEDDDNPEEYLWQSFDDPTDTLLPGMKLGWNLKTGLDRFLTSWKNQDDPSIGDYSFRIDPRGFPQAFLMNRLVQLYRSGPWNGIRFSGTPELKPHYIFNFSFTYNQEEIDYSFSLANESIFSRLVVNQSGLLERFIWVDTSGFWNVLWDAPKDQCDTYGECGVYGICDPDNSPVCKCLKGFEPKNQKDWYLRDGSGGCIRKTEFECQKDDGFLKLEKMKLPDSSRSFADKNMGLKECEEKCRKNCSCTAYSNADISNGGSGCVIWIDNLVDLREYTVGGQDLYVRVAASDLEDDGSTDSKSGPSNKKRIKLIVTVTVILTILLLGLGIWSIQKGKIMKNIWRKKTEKRDTDERSQDLPSLNNVTVVPKYRKNADDLELPLFDLGTIAAATNNFSNANKLGQGGFGCVYKGTLGDGVEVAVKRLSQNSRQGVEELKTEVRLIARLQHRNLVRLLGCCVEGKEMMLVYEYMQNRSLDSILFNRSKCLLLDWGKRFNIVVGIARGLLYLHQDSRFRIIHRDLKASNILLDAEMKPKISDFGMARIFGAEQTEANTRRVVGTYGYMSPEYAMDGLFSTKSDVFSFGVLVLEIVSGKKNRGFYCSNNQRNLLGHAWTLWKEGRILELLDASIGDSFFVSEVLRCIQMGLLCVQERAEDRPTMCNVLLMLSGETSSALPQPKQPGFCMVTSPIETESSSNKQESSTVNLVTVTMLQAR